ncbi:MAG: phosphatase PAP2 family protein [Elusimicrobia bacterium]|nr:phosphatase PAP2 family protein [Elusimicrobiota bacterium]
MSVKKFIALMILAAAAACSAQRPVRSVYKPPTQLFYAQEAAIQAIDLTPPPADGSEADKKDLSEVLRMQNDRTPQDCARVKREAASGYESFFGDIGPFPLPVPPEAAAFLKRVRADAARSTYVFQKRFARKRPFLRDPEIKPCLPLEDGYAYPSGHSTLAMTFALVLADLRPDLREQLLARASSVARGRALGGVHHPSDTEAGKELAIALYAEIAKSPSYNEDLAKIVKYIKPAENAR